MTRGDDIWKQRRAELVRFIQEEGQGPLTPEAVKLAKQVRKRRVGVTMAIPKGKR